MSCGSFKERVEAYVDGQLQGAAREEVAAHLEGCADCAAEVKRLERLGAALGAAREIEPSPGFEAAFLRRLRAEAEAESRPGLWQRWFGGWHRWVFVAAGAAAAVAVTFAVWPERETPLPRPEPVAREAVKNLKLLRDLEVAANLEVLEGVTNEELDAVAELPELGG